MFNLAGDVLIEDEFLRDGLQNESRIFTVAEKLTFLQGLEAAGLKRIQLGSFVHPKRVPQMANTDDLFAAITPRPGVTYTALILNDAGLSRAIAAGVRHLSASVSASETHSRKNLNKSVTEARAAILPILDRAQSAGIAVRAGIQSALGCGFEGQVDPAVVIDIARSYSSLGVSEINIADTAGLSNPRAVYDLCRALRDVVAPQTALSLHLHDTRSLGIANMVAGLQAGVRIFDSALGGLGGCPFIPAATGNIATEDAAFALGEMGLTTGIDWAALTHLTRDLETLLGRRLPGRMAHMAAPTTPPCNPQEG